ncbi:MAG: hypothetical protein ACPGLY_09385 [Rubripirellula sp.]
MTVPNDAPTMPVPNDACLPPTARSPVKTMPVPDACPRTMSPNDVPERCPRTMSPNDACPRTMPVPDDACPRCLSPMPVPDACPRWSPMAVPDGRWPWPMPVPDEAPKQGDSTLQKTFL